MEKFIAIKGINHLRFVGICKADNKAVAFSPFNVDGYRPPKTVIETGACIMAAKQYYSECIPEVRTGDFSVESIFEMDIKYAAEQLAENILNENNYLKE